MYQVQRMVTINPGNDNVLVAQTVTQDSQDVHCNRAQDRVSHNLNQ